MLYPRQAGFAYDVVLLIRDILMGANKIGIFAASVKVERVAIAVCLRLDRKLLGILL